MNHLDVLAERIAELEDLAAAEGLRLPMPASVIALHESAGHVVDLRTGAVLHGGAHLRLWRVLPAAADEPDPEPEPIAVAWLTVAPGVFLGVQAGDAAASFLAGGAE